MCALLGGLAATSVAEAGAKYVYIANANQAVKGFAVNATTGALTQISGANQVVDEFPFSIAGSPNGNTIYVVNPNSTNIAGFNSNATTGALTGVPNNPFAFPPGTGAVRMTVHPNGTWAYANAQAYDVLQFNVAGTGRLTLSANAPAVAGIASTLEITANGKFMYAANAGLSILPDPAKSNNISAFTINASNGALREIGTPVKTGQNPRRLTSDASSKWLLVSSLGNAKPNDRHDIRTYSINQSSGALAEAQNLLTDGLNFDIRFEPSGKFVYVSFGDLKKVSIYSFNATSGALTKVKDVGLSAAPGFLGVDPSGKFLFVMTKSTTTSIVSYKIGADGSLTSPVTTQVDGDTGTVGMVVSGTP